MPIEVPAFRHAFRNLKELQICATLTSWANVLLLAGYMPSLQVMEAGYNQYIKLSIDSDGTVAQNVPSNFTLSTINFDSNQLTDWTSTCEALRPFGR